MNAPSTQSTSFQTGYSQVCFNSTNNGCFETTDAKVDDFIKQKFDEGFFCFISHSDLEKLNSKHDEEPHDEEPKSTWTPNDSYKYFLNNYKQQRGNAFSKWF